MPREFTRSERMAEQLRRELADIVKDEIKDPRLGFFSFTEVRMSRDLSHAVVYTSVLEIEDQAENHAERNQLQETVDVLNRAAGFIRKQIARRIQARIVPTLKFVADDSAARGSEMDIMIRDALDSDKKK